MQLDSVDKIVDRYLALVTKTPLRYKGKTYEPQTLVVSPSIFRGYTCPSGCGGCCGKFSLDYLPTDPRPADERIKPRQVPINDTTVTIFTDPQGDNPGRFCRHLIPENGRCGIHGEHPFSCDFELIRAAVSQVPHKPNRLNTRLYGRGWAMLRAVDNERGALCTMTEISEESVADTVRRMVRLQEWADHFAIDSWVPEILTWMRDPNQRTIPLTLTPTLPTTAEDDAH